jgi:hypothetical protein
MEKWEYAFVDKRPLDPDADLAREIPEVVLGFEGDEMAEKGGG